MSGKLDDTDRTILSITGTQKKIATIAAEVGLKYSSTHQRLAILVAGGYVTKISTMGNKVFYVRYRGINASEIWSLNEDDYRKARESNDKTEKSQSRSEEPDHQRVTKSSNV